MEKRTLDKIISFLREQVVGGAPTMSVGNTGYQSGGDQNRAGFDPVQGKMMKTRKYMKLPAGMRKRWKKKDES